jgi:SAM-dependent methyltransferase
MKTVLPDAWVQAMRRRRARMFARQCEGLDAQQIFSKIYDDGAWGRSGDPAQPFYSGSGSHDEAIIAAYVEAVRAFLQTFDRKPDVVDLGCGDFFVGALLRPWCGAYTACDIVPKLVAFNRAKFAGLGVDFRTVDLVADELPPGEVVFIRQVLQHLSNAQIAQALPKIRAAYRFLVLTEHLPGLPDFLANLDKQPGAGVRTGAGSGVVLTRPPFDLSPADERVLCEIGEFGGVIRTTLYTLH